MKVGPPKKRKGSSQVAEMRAEYDFSAGERGKHAKRFAEGTSIIVLDPDLVDLFPDSQTVNETLPALSKIADRQRKIISSGK